MLGGVVRRRWSRALVFLILAAVVVLMPRLRGAHVRDFVAPALVALCVFLVGSGFLARTVPGWPRVAPRTWLAAWLRFLGVVALALAVGLALFLTLGGASSGLAILRLELLGLSGALLLAALPRLAARPPKPPPIPEP
jgi:hypothetical protein